MDGQSQGAFAMLYTAGPVIKAVVLALVCFSLISWTIAFNKWKELRKLRIQSEGFLETVKKSESLKGVAQLCKEDPQSPFSCLVDASMREAALRKTEDDHRPMTLEAVMAIENVLKATTAQEAGRFEKRLSFLATTANTAPFIGLFGTVWGIMESFRNIGLSGSTSLAVVAPGISEALITTALGLATAIPAVLAYNFFLGRLKAVTETMESASVYILNHLTR